MNKAELIIMLTERHAEKTPLTPTQFFNALDNATVETKQQLVEAVNEKNAKVIAEILLKVGNKKRRNLANTKVTELLLDDTLTTVELLELL